MIRIGALEKERADRLGSRSDLEIRLAVSSFMGREPPYNPKLSLAVVPARRVPELATIWALGQYYGCNPAWLAFGDAYGPRPAQVTAEVLESVTRDLPRDVKMERAPRGAKPRRGAKGGT
jgi:hypothetical protein